VAGGKGGGRISGYVCGGEGREGGRGSEGVAVLDMT